jgi:large subunit ribosomal protein L24
MWIRADDTVMVTTGDDQGKRGRVLRLDRAAGKVVVEGVNRAYKHVRRSQRNPQGGRLSKEMPIPQSNVALVCQACNAATRVGARILPDGSKERFCRKCGAGNGAISPPKSKKKKAQTAG